MSNKSLGSVVTVINNSPHKFNVNYYETGASSADPLNMRPLLYTFDGSVQYDKGNNIKFIVEVSSTLVEIHFKRSLPQIHNAAIRFGINSIKKTPVKLEYLLTSELLETLNKTELMHGQELRKSILKFYYEVYLTWPREVISHIDLIDNFGNDEKEIKEWLNNLESAGLIKISRGFHSYRSLNKEQYIKIQAYRINAEKEDKIAMMVDESSKASNLEFYGNKIFLSYNTKDKVLAGNIKTELVKLGYDVFLAHEDINPSDEWLDKILIELKERNIFIPIITPNFQTSKWTDQESGQAMAYGKLIIPLLTKKSPHGFLSRIQGEWLHEDNLELTCQKLSLVISSKNEKWRISF
ncbi:MAG: toll/interleukin-1 receptor domain-containing protein [Candidatus Zixiibacteriota bacterium]